MAATDKPELHEIDGVRIFAAGRARGENWTESEIDAIVRNGNANFELVRPTVVVGHEENQPLTDGLPSTHKQSNSGAPAFGVVTNLRKEFAIANGERVPFLVAKFGDVPTWLAGLIRGRAYRTVSAEIYPKPPEGVTNAEGPMLRRVALLGGEMPQIKTLGDLPLPEYQRYAESKFANVVASQIAPAPVALRDVKRTNEIVVLFSEVQPMSAYKFVKGKVKKFADLKPESKVTLKKFEDMPAEGAPPSANRQEMIQLLADAGIDTAVLTDAVPDNVLAEMVRVLQAMQSAQAAVPNAEPVAPAVVTQPAPPAPAPQPAAIPTATPSSVTLKYGERDVTPQQYAELIRAENAEALKQIEAFRTATKRDAVATFCETQVKAGKMLPVERDAEIELALSLDDSVKKFGEGQTLTALDAWRKRIENRPNLVKLAERCKNPSSTPNAQLEIVQKFAETWNDDKAASEYVAGFAEVLKNKPDATAEMYGVPRQYAA